MRLLRLLRILKLLKANRALDRISQAIMQIRAELMIFLFVGVVIIYLAAVGIYHFEHIRPARGLRVDPREPVVGARHADDGGLRRRLPDHHGRFRVFEPASC